MKNLFGDYDNFNNFTVINTDELDKKYRDIAEEIKNKQPKETYSFISGIILFIGFLFIILATKDKFEEYKSLFFIIGGIITGIGFIYSIFSYFKENKKKKDPELLKLKEKFDKCDDEIKEFLAIPEDSTEVDVITNEFDYYNLSLPEDGIPINVRINIIEIYKEDNNLCIFNGDIVIKIPLNKIKEVKEIKKRVKYSYWWKDESRDSAKYDKYIDSFNKRFTTLKSFYQITVEDNNMNEYCIFVPNYDMKYFDEIINY